MHSQWQKKYGTPPPTRRGYSKPSECMNFWAWLWRDWNFVNSDGYREIGSRIFGIEKMRYYVIPRGALKF